VGGVKVSLSIAEPLSKRGTIQAFLNISGKIMFVMSAFGIFLFVY